MIPDTPLAYADSFKGVGVEGLLEFVENVDPWYKDFTARDMRDIAACFYAPCSADFLVDGQWIHSDDDCVAAGLIKGLCVFEVRNVKLKLRSLSSLTKSELNTLFKIAFKKKPVRPEFHKDRESVRITCSTSDKSLIFWMDGEVKSAAEGDLTDDAVPARWPAVMRRLQAWGFYVPGTIRKQFVDLQQ